MSTRDNGDASEHGRLGESKLPRPYAITRGQGDISIEVCVIQVLAFDREIALEAVRFYGRTLDYDAQERDVDLMRTSMVGPMVVEPTSRLDTQAVLAAKSEDASAIALAIERLGVGQALVLSAGQSDRNLFEIEGHHCLANVRATTIGRDPFLDRFNCRVVELCRHVASTGLVEICAVVAGTLRRENGVLMTGVSEPPSSSRRQPTFDLAWNSEATAHARLFFCDGRTVHHSTPVEESKIIPYLFKESRQILQRQKVIVI